jgi:trans-aconitate 2-methyltransferase
MMRDWSPDLYLAFADERTRPARDLLAHVPVRDPARVHDLGCGPGNSTELLAEAFPAARLTGIDNSPAMLAKARAALPGVDFVQADLAAWRPEAAADLLFANATFQWLPDHVQLLQRFIGDLIPGGVLAVQMPDNLDEPSHVLMLEAAGRWPAKLSSAVAARASLLSPDGYYHALKPLCRQVDVWRTCYYHPLEGVDGIVRWLSATGLRPFLEPLDERERGEFLAEYRARLAQAYPAAADGSVLLRFPRLFIVAVR